jgi:hypothetical protein
MNLDNRGRLKTKHYNISSNSTTSPAYGVYISQPVCYSRACAQYINFLDRAQLLPQKLLKQGYVAPKLKYAVVNATKNLFLMYTWFFPYHRQYFYQT